MIAPYGGKLVNLIVSDEERLELKNNANRLPSIQLSETAVCDLELLATGAFSPLDRFMNGGDHASVLEEMRLISGHLFPIPVIMPVHRAAPVKLDQDLALRDSKNELLAILTVEEISEWNREETAQKVLGTQDTSHPFIAEMQRWGPLSLSGALRVLQLPEKHDFKNLRHTPQQTREKLGEFKHQNVVAFQTRNPLHRAHEELTKLAVKKLNGVLLLHPVVGMTKPGDIDHFTRVRTYKALVDRYYDKNRVLLSLLPLAMRMGGPREALWHMLIRRNFGANYFIVGRDHASPGVDSNGTPFYGPYDAQELVAKFSEELGVGLIKFGEMVYLPDENRYEDSSTVPSGKKFVSLSGTSLREDYIKQEKLPPPWFLRPEVARILADQHRPSHRQGVCIWFTGLSGAGKSTIAEILTVKLVEHGRQVTLLDGDVIRTNLSKGLGFSKEDRDANILRIGFVSSEIVRHGGLVVCAAISPYRAVRNEVRGMIGAGQFIEIFVDTPIEVCESRDPKGLYAKARRGEIKGFTGIDDPYEAPEDPELILKTTVDSAESNANAVLKYLIELGFVLA